MEQIRLQWATWTSLKSGVVSFSSDWPSRSLPKLWWGEDRLELAHIHAMKPEEFAHHSGYCIRNGMVHFFLANERLEGISLERGLFVAASFNQWGEAIGDQQWALVPSSMDGRSGFRLSVPITSLPMSTSSYFKFVTGEGRWLPVPEDAPNFHIEDNGIRNYRYSPWRSGRHLFSFQTPLPLAQSEDRLIYFDNGSEVQSVRMSPGVFLKSLGTDAPLGAIVSSKETSFAIFVPRAARVDLFLFQDRNGPEGQPIAMQQRDNGVWWTSVPGNRHGWFYYYSVVEQQGDEGTSFDPADRIPDPYALAVAGPRGPGIVVDKSRYKRDRSAFVPPPWQDLVVMEAHVRDLIAQAPLELSDAARMGFSGLTKWAGEAAFPPALLGVNAIELQPIQEFDTLDPREYAWGYMPMNYFAPASQYAQDPAGLSQIDECRELIDTLHQQGLAVIMDVVYNHTGEPNYFQFLDKEYYFLLNREGDYENHSGCGNTFDCNTPMVRRLIRDSLLHWIEFYDIDGFRFDLGELIGVDTLSWLEPSLKAAKPGIILIAEPWSFRGHIARDLKPTGFASWNDGYREFIRRYLTLQVDASELAWHLGGSTPEWTRFPAQTVNYVDSHDDRCWIDKITENDGYNGYHPTSNDRRRTHLMISLLMVSLGMPMLACGVEAMKSKHGVHNTYLRGDLNAIPYGRYAQYAGTVDYFRQWVRFRLGRQGRLLRLASFPEKGYLQSNAAGAAFGVLINANFSRGADRLLYVINPTHEEVRWHMDAVDFPALRQLADTERWGSPFLTAPLFGLAADHVVIPPLSCGLFQVPV